MSDHLSAPRRLVLALLALCALPACGGQPTAEPASSEPLPTSEREPAPEESITPVVDTAPPDVACGDPIAVYEDGARAGDVCDEDLAARGLTILDLSGGFAPHIFKEAPELGEMGHQPYREAYLALADERWDALPPEIERETGLELFGIFPTFRVLRARLDDDENHRWKSVV